MGEKKGAPECKSDAPIMGHAEFTPYQQPSFEELVEQAINNKEVYHGNRTSWDSDSNPCSRKPRFWNKE